MKRYRALLVGAGAIGYGSDRFQPASHFGVFHRHARFELAGVVETSAARRALVARRHGVPVFADLADARSLAPDLVVVATPDATHPAMLREILAWRPRLVFCEKPVAATAVEVRDVARAYARNDIALAVNYTRRFLPELNAVGRALRAGRWGRPRIALVTYTRGFVHNAVHLLDLLIGWFGAPQRVEARQPHPVLHWSNGLQATFISIPGEKLACNELDLHCERGRVRLTADRRLRVARVVAHAQAPHLVGYGREKTQVLRYDRALTWAADRLARCLDGRAALPTPVADSVSLHAWMDRMKEKN